MRPWLLLRHHGIAFEEIRVLLFSDGYQQILARYSPSLRVPVLLDADLAVWDSLAAARTAMKCIPGSPLFDRNCP